MTNTQNIRLIAIAAAAAVVAFILDSTLDLENSASGDVLGPVLFGVFALSILSVIGLSIRLLVNRNRAEVS